MIPGGRATRRRTVIFLHLPKTGGRTLEAVLQRQFGADGVFSVYEPSPHEAMRRYERLSDAERREYEAIAGHVDIRMHEKVPDECEYVTLLRDPVSRVVSSYFYARRSPGHSKHAAITDNEMGLADVIRSGIMPMLDNGQTRVLSGWWGEVGECPPEAADEAMENIDRHVAVAGVTERFDESLLLMGRELGWSWPKMLYVSRNVSRDRPRAEDLPEETVDLIREHNRVDTELYRRVQKRFEEAVAGLGTPFSLAAATFRGANRAYGRVKGLRDRMGRVLGPMRSAA